MLRILSCVCWPSLYLLWRNVYLGLLPIFGLGCLFFCYWAAWAACKSWRLINRADLPVICGCFPLAIYVTFGSIYKSMPLSHFIPAYPSPSVCPQVHSVRLRLYSCPAPRFFMTIFFFFRFHIYVLAYSICFFLSDLLHSVWQADRWAETQEKEKERKEERGRGSTVYFKSNCIS